MTSNASLMAGVVAAATLAAANATAQTFPSKAVRILTAAGGGVDFLARNVAQGITAPLGLQVVVENRGGSAAVAAERVMKSAPDGHTLIMYGSGFWTKSLLYDNARYDPVHDFAWVVMISTAPNALVTNPAFFKR